MFGSFSQAVYFFYLILPLLSIVNAVTTTTATTAPTSAEESLCPKAGTFVCASGYAGQFCEITTTNATDYLSSVLVAVTPDSMYMSIDFSISKTGQIAVSELKNERNNIDMNGKRIKILNESLNIIKAFEVANEDRCIAYGSDHLLYVGGSSNVVYVYNNTGDYVSEFPTNAEEHISSITGSEGLLYLTYYGLQKVLIYNEDGTNEASIEQGLDGQPFYVTVTEDKIFVSSTKSYSIYDKNYAYLQSLPFNHSSLNFDEIGGGAVAVDNFGNMLVPDIGNDQLIVFNANYERMGTFGKNTSTGQSVFSYPLIVQFSPDFRYFFTLGMFSGMHKFEVPSSGLMKIL